MLITLLLEYTTEEKLCFWFLVGSTKNTWKIVDQITQRKRWGPQLPSSMDWFTIKQIDLKLELGNRTNVRCAFLYHLINVHVVELLGHTRPHPDLWAIGDPIDFPRGRLVCDGSDVPDDSS